MIGGAAMRWHGVKLLQPDWSPHSHSLALGAEMIREGVGLHFILNAFWEPLDFELPTVSASEPWRRWIDTALESPEDIVGWQTAPAVAEASSYRVAPRTVVVLWRTLKEA
jgi:glycogen operon protein